ncbi:agmatinase [archaeon]|nr:agmatinase [archaeon]
MKNFMNLPEQLSNEENSKVEILKVPYEGTTSYGKGTKNAPCAIIEASNELESYDIETDSEPYKVGIYTKEETDLTNIKPSQKFRIAIGGEHSITFNLIKNLNQNNLSILQIDAHADLKNEFEGRKDSHACVMRRIFEINNNITQVGIRSLDQEEVNFIQENKIKTFFMKNIREDWIQKVLETLTDKVYITIDMDGFDPTVIPAVGTPEPNGLQYNQVYSLLREVFNKKEVVGMDFVELMPKEGDLVSPYTTAKLIYQSIALKMRKENWL